MNNDMSKKEAAEVLKERNVSFDKIVNASSGTIHYQIQGRMFQYDTGSRKEKEVLVEF
jgi:hypothetical protein